MCYYNQILIYIENDELKVKNSCAYVSLNRLKIYEASTLYAILVTTYKLLSIDTTNNYN